MQYVMEHRLGETLVARFPCPALSANDLRRLVSKAVGHWLIERWKYPRRPGQYADTAIITTPEGVEICKWSIAYEFEQQEHIKMPTGNLVIGRIQGMEGKYITYLFSVQEGRILESSKAFTDTETRTFLAASYGLSETEIEALMTRANAHPGI